MPQYASPGRCLQAEGWHGRAAVGEWVSGAVGQWSSVDAGRTRGVGRGQAPVADERIGPPNGGRPNRDQEPQMKRAGATPGGPRLARHGSVSRLSAAS